MPDRLFADPRLAAIYDDIDGDRLDLDHYERIVQELGATSVLDVGCGTGVFAVRLARAGVAVAAVDPAGASLDVARVKPGADLVTWLHGDATTLPQMHVDVATMTGNVAQVFVTDEGWYGTLAGVHRALRERGHLVFESRDPARRAWKDWAASRPVVHQTAAGPVEHWTEVLDVELPFVSFRHTYGFIADGTTLTSDSTLRFRDRDELELSLRDVGYDVVDVRGAPDRPGCEMVVIARARPVG